MNYRKRREIQELAGRVRNALALPGPRLDVERAVLTLGGKIKPSDNWLVEACVRKSADTFVIEIAGDPKEERTRFSIAHELGHVFLHMGFLVDPVAWQKADDYRDSPMYRMGHSEEEYEANEFAASLLMPDSEFRATAARFYTPHGYAIDAIASTFGVSVPAARNRGRWLGLFSWE